MRGHIGIAPRAKYRAAQLNRSAMNETENP